jgi:general secretion pathway protein D
MTRTLPIFCFRWFLVLAIPSLLPAIAQFGGGGGRGGGGLGGGFGGGGARSGGAGGASGQYYSNGQVGEAIVTSDPETRRLIVITDEATSRYVGQVVTNLDTPKPQVLINVVFLEVTYSKNFDFGVESSFHKNIDSSTTLGLTNLFSVAGLAAQGAANSYGVPGAGIYQIAGRDFSVTLRAIAENGKLEILSRPTILARNNQQAYILVGQQVPLITSVTYNTINNQPINSITYRDVGIILRVTPFITSEGYVEMIVSPETSSLDKTQTVDIGGGAQAPVINTRSADTVVVTPDGQSVVIGGLMEADKSSTVSKIPVLGDIPWLGNLFKRTIKSGNKTELIILLTPHIVRSPMDLVPISHAEAVRATNAPNAFSEEELNRFLDGVPFKKLPPNAK